MTHYPCLKLVGGLLAADIVEQIADGSAPGQKPADFGLPARTRLSDEIAAAWSEVRAYWSAFQHRLARLDANDPATSVTRDRWMIPLMSALGYELDYTSRAREADGRTYPISHRANAAEGAPPVHIAGCRQSLDRRPTAGALRMAPHSMLQEYLNRSEALWGIVTNGYELRLLRDSLLLRRLAYVQFDLRQMMEGEQFADFGLLYRLLHRSRLPRTEADAADCWLETYYRHTVEQGGRVREHLRDGVEQALLQLANGLLAHPANSRLRERASGGALTAMALYQQLLLLIYRLLFLMVAEERGLIRAGRLYHEHYGLARLRRLAEVRSAYTAHSDLWLSLQTLFRLLHETGLGEGMGLVALNGDLFEPLRTPDLNDARLTNADLLTALWHLSLYREDTRTPWRRVNYAALDVEELGSVYESLLDYHPLFKSEQGRPVFTLAEGTERKSTGPYYTPPELVHELIESALVPVIHERLSLTPLPPLPEGEGGQLPSPAGRGVGGEGSKATDAVDDGRDRRESALLSIKICDPASGSGHFLLAAARRLGRALAQVRAGDDEPSPEQLRQAVREVVRRCIYAVDKNPLAVDLCKVALWIESYAEGQPLTFLDHHIKCGDSLVGVFDLAVLRQGIPDAAYQPLTGDDRKIASDLKKRNRREREGQLRLDDSAAVAALGDMAALWRQLAEQPDSDVAAIRRKQEAYARAHAGDTWRQLWTACNLWTAAFFLPAVRADGGADALVPTSGDVWDYLRRPRAVSARLVGAADALAEEARFFHWPLEFPDVFFGNSEWGVGNGEWGVGNEETTHPTAHSPLPTSARGFDVVLGNPPWERIKLQEQEFFAARDPEIASAPNKAARERLIKALPQTNPALWQAYRAALHLAEANSQFLRGSGRFPLSAHGDITTYQVFAELDCQLVADRGRSGFIVPTGIATDDSNKTFFADLVSSGRLVSLFDFENRAGLFPAVDSRYKFSLLTVRGDRAPRQTESLPSPSGRGAGGEGFVGRAAGGEGSIARETEAEDQGAEFVFFATRAEQLRDPQRRFRLSAADFARINPNTRTCPVFRTRQDAELTRQIYARVPVLVDETTGANPWGISFLRMFDMANDSHLFRPRAQLEAAGWRLQGNCFVRDGEVYLPLYEAKMIWQYDHRFGSYGDSAARGSSTHLTTPTAQEHADPTWLAQPWYWVPAAEVAARLGDWQRGWLLGFRDITNATNERTAIFSLLPRVGVGHTMPLAFGANASARDTACLIANVNALAFDYVARLKVGGMHLTYGYLRQMPVLPPDRYTAADLAFIVPRVLELVYTARDVGAFADDVWREADQALRDLIEAQWRANAAVAGGVGNGEWGVGNRQSGVGKGDRGSLSCEAGAVPDSPLPTPNSLLPTPYCPPPTPDCPPPIPPFRWDEERRAVLRAELDAYYARLYGLTETQLRYILDPADVHGPDFPGETFRVLKEKEIRQYGEYRTRRLVLEAWERLEG